MKDDNLQILIHSFSDYDGLVLILDSHWGLIWANREGLPAAGWAEQLHMTEADEWKAARTVVMLSDQLYDCRLICNTDDVFRIALLDPMQPKLFTEPEVFDYLGHSITVACDALNITLESHEDYAAKDHLRSLDGSSRRIRRISCMQHTVDRLVSGVVDETVFSVQHVFMYLHDMLQKLTRGCIEIGEWEIPNEICHIRTELHCFAEAVACGMLLSLREPELCQRLRLKVSREGETICIRTALEPVEGIERPDRTVKNPAEGFGACDKERMLLTVFCARSGGSWRYDGNSGCCVITMPLVDTGNAIRLANVPAYANDPYFGGLAAVLARVNYLNRL